MTTTDKSKELNCTVTLVNEKLHFLGKTDTSDAVSIDYTPPLGDNLGYTSLELFLMSLASCVGSAVLVLLRKKGKAIRGFDINATGIRQEQHPTCFSTITFNMALRSPDVNDEEFGRVIGLADEKLCPVYAMIKGNVEVIINRSITI